MRVWLWHVHGSWATAFVQGDHTYLLPVVPDRGPDGRGRARTWDWPRSAVEVTEQAARDEDVDVFVLQRPNEVELAERWTGRRPGRDVPAVYVEHNAPSGPAAVTTHPLAERDDIPIVHVTHFNALMWDSGSAPTTVIEHGVIDPGYCYRGDLRTAAAVVNEPERRHRVAGTDLLLSLAARLPIDLFGLASEGLGGRRQGLRAFGELDQAELHAQLARRRVYLHPYRWTSLGLSLIEAMMLGMPVVTLATTGAPEAVPADCGVVTNDRRRLVAGLEALLADPDLATAVGHNARRAARKRYSLDRFLEDWDVLFEEVAR